jgi:hypothetical protein
VILSSGDQGAVIPGRGKAANPEFSGKLDVLGWVRIAASRLPE